MDGGQHGRYWSQDDHHSHAPSELRSLAPFNIIDYFCEFYFDLLVVLQNVAACVVPSENLWLW